MPDTSDCAIDFCAAPTSAELPVAATARARPLDAVVTQIDAMPAPALNGPPDPTPPRAG